MTVEIDAEGKRELNAALQVWMDGYDPRAVMADSPMGNFIAGFYAARGWTPRSRASSPRPFSEARADWLREQGRAAGR